MTAYKYYWRNGLSKFRNIGSDGEITLDNLGPDRLILGSRRNAWRSFSDGSRPWARNTSCSGCATPTREARPTRI